MFAPWVNISSSSTVIRRIPRSSNNCNQRDRRERFVDGGKVGAIGDNTLIRVQDGIWAQVVREVEPKDGYAVRFQQRSELIERCLVGAVATSDQQTCSRRARPCRHRRRTRHR